MAIDELSDFGVPRGSAPSADGATWGLASICFGGVALLVAPLILILNHLMSSFLPLSPRPLVGVVLILTLLGVATMLGLAGFSIAFGLKGRRIGHDIRRDSPLATAGILLGTAAGIGWIIVSIQFFMILFT